MALPPKHLCKLQRGKALAAFPSFVDTFNWLVDFCANLIGESESTDYDKETGGSDLRVDRTIPDFPVIRGGGKGGGSLTIVDNDEPQNRVTVVGDLYLASADDSNIKFNIKKIDGRTILTAGVYYI